MNDIEKQISTQLTTLSPLGAVWVAYSGGLDSTVLLHALTILGVQCKAIHINHGLSINADIWQRQCSVFAAAREVPFTAIKVDVAVEGNGVEAAARSARYAAIAQNLAAGDVLLTGHHRDDQIETFFLRLLRGAGLRGLGAMRPTRSLGEAMLARPILSVSRQALYEYAQQHELTWVEDESNLNTQYDRNLLRHTFVPQLKARWPQAEKTLQNTVQHLQAAEDLLQEYGSNDLALCDLKKEKLGHSIALEPLQAFSPTRTAHVLRCWITGLGHRLPDTARMTELEKLIAAKDDASPLLNVDTYSLCRFQQRLYCLPRAVLESKPSAAMWNSIEPLQAEDGSELRFISTGAQVPLFKVTYRQGGERCKPIGRSHSQALKKLFQERNIEPWLRAKVPLIYYGDALVAVGDYWLCETGSGTVISGTFEWHFDG